MNLSVTTLILFWFAFSSSSSNAQEIETPTPAPAPAPDHVNLTELLSVAGPFHTFLQLIQSSKVIDTLQNQANNTEEGLTLFVPRDSAFSSLKNKNNNPSLSNLTQDQLKSLCLFHALPHYYSLADFRNLSQRNPVPTFAGAQYALNFTDNSGTVRLDSGWTRTKVTSAVYSTDPVAIYETDKVLLPEAIFGTDIPPMPAPAPAPEIAPSAHADAPAADADHTGTSSSTSPSSCQREVIMNLGNLVTSIVIVGGLFLLV